MHPWPDHGESSWMAETVPISNTPKEANKKMGDMYTKAIGESMTNSAINQDEAAAAFLTKRGSDDHAHSSGCPCGDRGGAYKDRTYSFFDTDPWPSVKAKNRLVELYNFRSIDLSKGVNTSPKIAADERDVISTEGKGEVRLDELPWSYTSIDAPEDWLPSHPCSTECWHKDPVEVAARRYERVGRFWEASQLRLNFRGLSILHCRALQWYRWATQQGVLKGASKGKTLDRNSTVSFQTNLRSRGGTNGDLKDDTYFNKFFHGKEFLSDIFSSTLDEAVPQAVGKTAGGSYRLDNIYGSISMKSPVHEHHTVDLDLARPNINDPQGHCALDPRRIISQQLKDKISRNFYPNSFQHHTNKYDESLHAGSGSPISDRNYARWVLENNAMSDDSEDDSDGIVGPYVIAYPISHDQPQKVSAGGSKGLPARSGQCAFPETLWADSFFTEDSNSSDHHGNEDPDTFEGDSFPTISGEELEKLLEEAKGTVQFHRWQNAPAGRHQKEFKTLINLHKLAKNSESSDQERWRSREQAEKERKLGVTTVNPIPASGLYLPLSFTPSWTGISELPHAPILGKPEPDLRASILPNKKASLAQKVSKDLRAKPQPVGKETEDYTFITTDDIKFLRELKKQLGQIEALLLTNGGSETNPRGSSEKGLRKPQVFNEDISYNMTMQKLVDYVGSKTGGITSTSTQEKPFREALRTARPPPSISHRTEFENWFPQHQLKDLAYGRSELPQVCRGATPKRHHLTAQSGDVSFRPGSVEHHPFSQATKSPIFKKLVTSTGRFFNSRINILLSGFWVTENLFITALNFHLWAPGTTVESLDSQIEDFKSRNDGIELFVSNNCLADPANDLETIKVVLRAWDTSARIAIFQPEDKNRISPNFVGVDMLIEEDTVYSYNGAYIATVGYNSLEAARGDPLGLRLLTPGNRSVTFGKITISEGYRENDIHSLPVFAKLESGFSHGSYGRMCVIMEADQRSSGSIIGLVTGQCEESGPRRPEALSDFVSTFPTGFKKELRRISRS